jgi:hypothetical protein
VGYDGPLNIDMEVYITYEDRVQISDLLAACCHDAVECALSNWDERGIWKAMGLIDFNISCLPFKNLESESIASDFQDALKRVKVGSF